MSDRFKTRDEARAYYAARLAEPAPDFTNYDHDYLVAFWTFNARWLDCAPEGARFRCAPFLDKSGESCGTNFSENMGAGRALREARAARGVHPLSGVPAKGEQ